jgi:hypothetical protein
MVSQGDTSKSTKKRGYGSKIGVEGVTLVMEPYPDVVRQNSINLLILTVSL